MRALGLVVALIVGAMALAASCSYKPLYECADGGCWGEPTGDAGIDPADATSPAG